MTPLVETIEIEVPFHDVDPAHVVWHGNYFRYFEAARCALLERLGYNYREMAESGYVWPVVDMDARLSKPIRYHERIRVQARIVEWEYRLVVAYEILREDGEKAATGRTVQVPVDVDSGEMIIGVPDVFTRCMEAALKAAGE